jgi:ascorbate-specific PTS system EIIC-type component UlaA
VQNGRIGKGSCATVYKVLWLGKHFAEKHFDGTENKYFQEELSLLLDCLTQIYYPSFVILLVVVIVPLLWT